MIKNPIITEAVIVIANVDGRSPFSSNSNDSAEWRNSLSLLLLPIDFVFFWPFCDADDDGTGVTLHMIKFKFLSVWKEFFVVWLFDIYIIWCLDLFRTLPSDTYFLPRCNYNTDVPRVRLAVEFIQLNLWLSKTTTNEAMLLEFQTLKPFVSLYLLWRCDGADRMLCVEKHS